MFKSMLHLHNALNDTFIYYNDQTINFNNSNIFSTLLDLKICPQTS